MPARTDLDVVLADPDSDRRTAAAETLRSVGCVVREVAGACGAVAACREAQPAVLVVDRDACRSDDLRVLDAIKRDPDLFGIGVVVRARRLDVDGALDELARGAHGVLVDPLADAELVSLVRSAALTSALQEQLRTREAALEAMAFTDVLTSVPNRRFLDRQLAAQISAAHRHGRPLAVVAVDIDRFKTVNDAHGHPVGDEVLAELARRLGAGLRSEDHLGRFGGEEFLVIAPDTGAQAAGAMAERMRSDVASRPVDTAVGPVDVTISAGWAVWDGDAADELFSRADAALYRAKRAGRNRVVGDGAPRIGARPGAG